MRHFPLLKVFMSVISLISLINTANAASLSTSRCSANHDGWKADNCRPIHSSGTCGMGISDGSVSIEIPGLGTFSAPLQDPYEMKSNGKGKVIRSTALNFGGLVRGTAYTVSNLRLNNSALSRLDLYLNDDSSGNSCTRFRCGN
jgi:hypothetical protein